MCAFPKLTGLLINASTVTQKKKTELFLTFYMLQDLLSVTALCMLSLA